MTKPNEIEYYNLHVKMGWSNTQASDFFGVNVTTVRRWRTDKITAPKSVILCLKSLISKTPVKSPKYT